MPIAGNNPPSVGDIVKLSEPYGKGFEVGTLFTVHTVHLIERQITCIAIDSKTFSPTLNSGSLNVRFERCDLLSRAEVAEIMDKRADYIESTIETVRATAEKYRVKANILRKYKSPSEEIVGELFGLIQSSDDEKLNKLHKALVGRVKEELV